MTLKTDYKDDVFSENRKYQKIENGDGTVSLVDKTEYTQVGDTYGAVDINSTNAEVNKLSGYCQAQHITLPASEWSASTTTVNGRDYFTLIKTVQKIYDSNPTIMIDGSPLPTKAQQTAYDQLSYAIADSTSKTIAFYATKKPSTDILLIVKGTE